MQTVKIKLGSVWTWAAWKLFTLIASAMVIAVGFTAFPGLARFFLIGLSLSLVFIISEETAYGYACETGICYRRYFRKKLVPWRNVAAIHWFGPRRIRIVLKKGFLFRRTLWMDSAERFSGAMFSAEPPEVVRWLLVAKPEGCDGILLNGPGI